jgi:hypothetical protein
MPTSHFSSVGSPTGRTIIDDDINAKFLEILDDLTKRAKILSGSTVVLA